MNNIKLAKEILPVFEFEIPEELIHDAFLGAIELYVAKDVFEETYRGANKNLDGSSIITKISQFHSTSKSHIKNLRIGKLSKYIEQLTKQISLEYYSADMDYTVRNSYVIWYIGGVGDYISKHNHFPYSFVASTYLHIPENSSPINFGEDLEIYPKTGTCLIFPGNLYHEVKDTSVDRIVISMDLQPV
jgi:hypothetical protein